MQIIRSFSHKIRAKRPLFLQILFTALAFLLMVVSSNLFVRNMLRNHLRRDALDSLLQTGNKIEAEFFEPQTALISISETIRSMILNGESAGDVFAYMNKISAELKKNPDSFSFEGIYGYFDAFGGSYINSVNLDITENYDPTGFPWYTTAVAAGNRIAITPVYFDVHLNDYIFTCTRRIFDDNGKPLAVICLNLQLDRIRNYVDGMHLTKNSYGVLHDENMNIYCHPDPEVIGLNSTEVSGGLPVLASEALAGNDIFEREAINLTGDLSVVFSERINNGWILYIVTPKAEYYKELKNMALMLGVLGAVMALVLIVILIRVDTEKNKADEQSHEKGILLSEMEKMRKADERTRIMLDATPLGCKLWDKDINVIECNQEALNLFELQSKQEFFDRFFELSPKYQPCGRLSTEKASELIKKAFEEGNCRFEWMHQKLNGEPIPTEIILVRVKHREDYAVAGYIRDLREQNRMMQDIRNTTEKLEIALKEAQEANKAKSKFLAAMSHEIRTPMNVILGVTESQLMAETYSKEVMASYEKIYDSGNLLLHIINDILDLSKIEAGKFELTPTNYEVLSLINDAATMNTMRYGQKDIKFSLKVNENIPQHLYGDELRIKQIINNLLSNSFKYTEKGEIILSFNVEPDRSSEKTITLVICVSDTGQGMKEEEVNDLFKEYTRFNLEANRSTEGTGLGMTITNNIVKMMGGKISVESVPGKGSVFTVYLPQEVTNPALLGKDSAENLQNFNFSGMVREKRRKIIREPMPYGKVLIVDDIESNLNVAKLLLNPYQLQIETAGNGFEAIEKIKSGKVFDIVFMDHMMPVMDGIETVKKIREAGYTNPVLALTANAIAGQQEMFLKNGFDGFISKPIDIRQLNNVLNKFIRNRERRQIEEENIQEKPAENIPAENDEFNYYLKTINIPGVDTKIGLALYEDEVEIFISVLKTFIPNALNLIQKLSSVSQDTLHDYGINVHGLKGMSAGIGAEKVREAAYNLEMEAKAGNLEGVIEKNESLLEETRNLISNIQAWLDKQYNKSKPVVPQPDRALLVSLQKYCEDYDMENIDKIMDELEKTDYSEDNSLVPWLRTRINESDFSAVVSGLSEYFGESQ